MTIGHPAGPPVPPDADELTLLGGGWIWEQNARPLLEMLAMYAGSGFDPDEWSTAELHLATTSDASPDGWYTHAIRGGVSRFVAVMARKPSEGTVVLRVWGDDRPGMAERVDTLFDIGSMYRLSESG